MQFARRSFSNVATCGRKFFVGGNWKCNGSISQAKVGYIDFYSNLSRKS